MKVSTLAGAIMAVSLAATSAVSVAKDQGHGVITFKGAIIDAPCSIAQESQYQTVDMDQIANVSLKNGGKSNPTPFKIELRGCELGALKSATATFTGSPSSNPDLLALKGTAQGASLAIADHTGALIKLGSASPAQTLSDGDTYLQFSAYLQGDMVTPEGGGEGTAAEIVPGDFETFANFTLAYQ
ncbi:fimbrial protein [Pseudomonas putida]|uniref:fimbrial protein n=1 Tax=Pseudomonas putida TaxID=303 RepID=UPI002366EE8B|nr:fimbrial protein [Pseudomonas putida]MDD2047811.1 type 1 fimbrial protein [Pseudomonas putida]